MVNKILSLAVFIFCAFGNMALRGALDLEQIELFVDKRNVIEKMKELC